MNKPLAGIRILDLTHMLSGPFCTMTLADLGADMIKVEPLAGEGTRKLLATDPKNSIDGMGAYFITLNRNKRTMSMDLKTERGLELFYELVAKSDVVINNFAAGVPSKLKIDYEHLSKVNPKIITCSITGFGEQGPGAKRPAFDQVAQAFGGGMSITGSDSEHPMRAGIPIGDLGGGMFGIMGVLAALVERDRSGVGQHIDISMLDVQISLLNYMATMYFLSGQDPHPIGNSHFVHVPYNSYPTADGHLVICVITDNFWQNLKQVVNCPGFDKPEYDGQPGRLADKVYIDSTLTEIFKTDTTDNWLKKLNEARIPAAPVNTFSRALADDQVQYRNMVVELGHPSGKSTKGPGCPIKLSRTNEESFTPAPLLGENTDELMREVLGYDETTTAELKANGVIG
ncbi:crotonobetainyl-CoA:carnitine CoA-transferase CaiB-like acyl-CoA transferase [Litorivivens lipolytica]|uniref:Crotonobetainyl-CoA:carnitine CoA-transferase CaiB-like acyl-CoA transferase n=1 Tax=Litorivivens lipolytica TaxID=1524264 RepID=A0A7W4Z5E3_9GAMM|nr:CoA transferase [Litorivivens lipolytica]MBB3047042.1 crotonobetainyl-CoA:carnitine CoA-transferase CaiB-like acyl-CoA transferase [Litorivivens lipolytica]